MHWFSPDAKRWRGEDRKRDKSEFGKSAHDASGAPRPGVLRIAHRIGDGDRGAADGRWPSGRIVRLIRGASPFFYMYSVSYDTGCAFVRITPATPLVIK